MGYWNGDDLPFYHSMARQFPIGDRYFCSVMAQTYPNRRFLIAGTALGDISTDASGISPVDAPNGTIFDRLNQYGITWKDYYPDIPTCALFEPVFLSNRDKAVHVPQFFVDAASGNLPAFSLIDPYTNYSEESGDITVGEAYAAPVRRRRHAGSGLGQDRPHLGVRRARGLVRPRAARSGPSSRTTCPPTWRPATCPAPTTTPGSGCRAVWCPPGPRSTTSPTRSSTTPRSSSWSRPSGTCPP